MSPARPQLGNIVVGHARRTNDMHGAGLCSEFGKLQSCGRRSEINHGLRFGKGLERFICHFDAKRLPAHRFAHVHANPRMPCAFNGADQTCLFAIHHGLDQHLTHPARSSGNDDSWKIFHGVYPCNFNVVSHWQCPERQFHALLARLPNTAALGKALRKA